MSNRIFCMHCGTGHDKVPNLHFCSGCGQPFNTTSAAAKPSKMTAIEIEEATDLPEVSGLEIEPIQINNRRETLGQLAFSGGTSESPSTFRQKPMSKKKFREEWQRQAGTSRRNEPVEID